MLRLYRNSIKGPSLALMALLLAACASQQPVIDESIKIYDGNVPANLNGAWERDYSRGDDIQVALTRSINQLRGSTVDPGYSNDPRYGGGSTISQSQVNALVALARLADLITRPDYFTVVQTDHEMSIERKDDFSIFCEFYDGSARGAVTDYGSEVCGWDGNNFISHLVLPDGLMVSHRFTMGPYGDRMRVITTLSSGTARVPFVLDRFYRKFDPPEAEYNCVETLSMNRVCSTSELEIVP